MPILYSSSVPFRQPDFNSLAQSGFNFAQSKAYDLIEAQRDGLFQQTAVNATANSIAKNNLDIEAAKETGRILRDELAKLAGEPWPNSIANNPKVGLDPDNKLGFLSSKFITPLLFKSKISNRIGQYEYKDWTGYNLKKQDNLQKTEDRFKIHKKTMTSADFEGDRYSIRDFSLIFGDTRTDYFRFGLQTIDNLTPIENPVNGNSTLRLDNFKGTPWEQSDPVYFGFEIVFDAVSSPLFNGSVIDFLANYTGVSELASRILVYDEFINQFKKFFRTNAKPVQSAQRDNIAMTKIRPHFTGHANSVSNFANLDDNTPYFKPGKSAYFSNYIKKVTGLNLLTESNKGETFKYLPDYRKDLITITTTEDVTLSMGTLAHLYKLLYWSKPNGKHLVPDNLLRFNCDIIVSEVRNMQRVRKNIQTGDIQVLKDNVSRWVFSLKECQFYFDTLPVESDIDLGTEPKMYENFVINMDFKYSTHRLEKFVPNAEWGNYVSYDAGSIWKIGNKGSTKGATGSLTSNPPFVTVGNNSFNENGINKPTALNIYSSGNRDSATSDDDLDIAKKNDEKSTAANKEATDDQKTEEKTSKFKTPGKLLSSISSEQVKKALDVASAITGITPQRVINSITSKIRNSTFFDPAGTLGTAPYSPSPASGPGAPGSGGLFGTLYAPAITTNFTNIQFPASAQKLPIPVTYNQISLSDMGYNTTPSGNVKSLLNESLYKVYAAEKFKSSSSTPPESTKYFDIRGQLKDFLGGSLGDKLTD